MNTGRVVRRVCTRAAALVALAVSAADAQEWWSAMKTLGVSASLRAGYWSSTRDLDAINPQFGAVAWLKSTGDVSPRLGWFAEGWAAMSGPPSETRTRVDAREVYVDVRLGRLDARIGRQIVSWGRADGINPTDNLTPRDFTILVPDDADRRLGTAGIRATWYQGSLALSALWLPEFRPNRVSLPPPPAGTTFREHFDRWPGETWALRGERTGGTIDWSVSFMRGGDLQPDLRVATSSDGTTIVNLRHNRVWVVGADAAMNAGRFGLRAEAGYTGTEDNEGRDPFTRNHNIFAVLGADRALGDRFNVNVQYLFRYIRDFNAEEEKASGVAIQGAILNSQVARVQHGATARLRHSWYNETLVAELASTAWFGPRGIAFLPKGTYAINDHWKLLLGGELYRGERRSILGLLRANSVVFTELRLEF